MLRPYKCKSKGKGKNRVKRTGLKTRRYNSKSRVKNKWALGLAGAGHFVAGGGDVDFADWEIDFAGAGWRFEAVG
jgi:hypothetical protein